MNEAKNKITLEIYLDESDSIQSRMRVSSSSMLNLFGMTTLGKKLLDDAIKKSFDEHKCVEANTKEKK
jgi:hypothetical protein